MTQLRNVVRTIEGSIGAQFLLTFALITGLKWRALAQLPTWDSAMGVFPAALTLADNGFDLIALLAMPDYLEGGPNTHSHSAVTLLTALVIKIVGPGGHAYVVLHLIHFSIAAVALLTLFRFARPVFSRNVTLLFCLSVLLQPMFSTQVGYLYLEMPLFLSAVSALYAWTCRRFWLAVFWATLAYAIKDTGIIVVGALVAATLLERRALGQRIKQVLLILAAPVLLNGVLTVTWMLRLAEGSGPFALFPSPVEVFTEVLIFAALYLSRTPDVLLLLLMFLVGLRFWGRSSFRALRDEPSDPRLRTPEQWEHLVVASSGLLILLFLALFYIALPLVVRFSLVLPRYYVMVLPFLLLLAGYQVKRLSGGRERITMGWFGILCIFFSLNTTGRLYPSDVDVWGLPGNDPALTERSNAYRSLNGVEVDAVRYLDEELPQDALVYYGLYEHYLFNYPGLGYASGPLLNGHTFALESFDDFVTQGVFPPCTYVVYSVPALGGQHVHALLNDVAPREGLATEVIKEFRDGPYRITLSLVRTQDAVCWRG